jgi:hypothetical protein
MNFYQDFGVLDVPFPLYWLLGQVDTLLPFPPSVRGKNASGMGMLSGAGKIFPMNVESTAIES